MPSWEGGTQQEEEGGEGGERGEKERREEGGGEGTYLGCKLPVPSGAEMALVTRGTDRWWMLDGGG